MSDDLPKEEIKTGVDPKPSGRAGFYLSVKVVVAVLVVSVFAFMSVGFGETPYTTRHLASTIFTGGGLLPHLFSHQSAAALRAAADTMRGEINLGRGNYAEAERTFSQALDAYKTLDAVDTVCGHMCILGLARAASGQNKRVGAGEYFTAALRSAQKVYGPEHEVVAAALRELGFHEIKANNYAKAQSYYQRALELDTKGYGPSHFDVAYDMSCVGEMALMQKQYDKAIELLAKSLEIYKKARGEYHPSFFWVEESLAKAYFESKDYAQAARQFESVLARSDRVHGLPGKDYVRDLAWLAWSYHYDSNKERALIRAKKLFAVLEKKSDAEASTMLDSIVSAGDILMMIGEYKLAIDQYDRYLKLKERTGSFYDQDLRKILLYVAECYERLNQPKNAERYRAAYDADSAQSYRFLMQR